ncbi:LacI family DNA-binding transcriptional regulator [Paenibacillus massiliensis]|uniref:LacI family DNA-binding transcriptional regulator n=1 Tax=Paenibacillus massiliensis TaxID=225917 RepID=UPI000420C30C|nr:LacI family DNA-binding transcriptional regulator [Paenibacillus massiliensis]
MMKTIADIAKLAGVAKSTVSRYLNGGSVSEATKLQIERVIQEHNYIPNTFARSLKAKKAHIIGTIVPRLDSFATSQMLMVIDQELRDAGFQTLISNTSQDMKREIEAIYEFARQKVAGVILIAVQITDEHVRAAEETGLPILLVGQSHPHFACVIHDDYGAGQVMGEYIISMGHRRIIYLGVTEQDVAVGKRRKEGFASAIQPYDCEVSYVETTFSMTDAMNTAFKLLEEQRPSVIVCATDNIALGVMKAAFLHNIDIPSELSVTGFGGYDVTEIIHPTLTTVKYGYKETGRQAAQNIIKLVREELLEPVTTMNFELMKRESVDNKA